MEWIVFKTGASFLDQFHGLGVSICLAYLTGQPVEIYDCGLFFKLVCKIEKLPDREVNLSDLLVLPTLEQVLALDKKVWQEASLSITILDGLLAALFTVPGFRVVSVDDLLNKLGKSVTWDKCLEKITKALSRWQRFIDRNASNKARWLREALSAYEVDRPTVPCLRPCSEKDIAVLMTLDPSLGFSLHQPTSDSQLTQKKNLTVNGAPYAPIFAMIGATRFLRAQWVANDLVNLYVPLIQRAVISPHITLPLLKSTSRSLQQAALYQWLSHFSHQLCGRGLGYQTLQTQKASQSISLCRGYFDNSWLTDVITQTGPALVGSWKSILWKEPSKAPVEIDDLVEALMERSLPAWLNHVREVAFYLHRGRETNLRPYSILEIRKVMEAMNDNSSLSDLLISGTGTVQFGRALRQLGQVKKGVLLDLIAALDEIQNLEDFLRVLGSITQHCEFTESETVFIFVPDRVDVGRIIKEAQEYGVRIIANLLIVLSTAWYSPSLKEKGFSGEESHSFFEQRRRVGRQGTRLARPVGRGRLVYIPTKKLIRRGRRNG